MSESTKAELDSFLNTLVVDSKDDFSLESRNIKKITHLLGNYELVSLLHKIEDVEYLKKFNYEDLCLLDTKFKQLSDEVALAKEEIDLDEFYKRGSMINFTKLRKKFKRLGLSKRYPNFNIDRYEELVTNPVLELENYAGEKIFYSKFLVRKILIGINQMIFDEMDLYITTVGKEGSGKSCFCSQLILYFHWVLTEIGLIEYAYDVKKIFFSSLATMLEEQEGQEDNDYFRLFALDEGYELNRQNYREESSKLFKDGMRSDRKMQRIVLINLPQIGELETSILLDRVNFIFFADMDSDPETGTLKKGTINFHIIPRGNIIYSPYQKRNITSKEIRNDITKVMKDKNEAYKGIPFNTIVDRFNFKGVWGFNKEVYDRFIKKENKNRRAEGSIRISNKIAYIMFTKIPALKNWDFDMSDKMDKRMYFTFQKFFKKAIKEKFIEDPKLEATMKRSYEEA